METKKIQLHKDQPEIVEEIRPNGTKRIIQNFTGCTSLTDPTSANMSDINFLMEKFKPDELQLYLASKATNRQPIEGYDFSKEPDINSAMNEVARIKEAYQTLPYEIQHQFPNYVEFMKFADNPTNYKKLVAMGLVKETAPNDAIQRDENGPKSSPTKEKQKPKVTESTDTET